METTLGAIKLKGMKEQNIIHGLLHPKETCRDNALHATVQQF